MEEPPQSPVPDGEPALGTHAGRFPDTDLRLSDRGVGRVRRLLSEKRWQWFGAFDGTLAVGGAVVDTGPLGTAFLWVADREAGKLLVDADVVVPSPLVTVSTAPASGVVADPGGERALGERVQPRLVEDSVVQPAEFHLLVDAVGAAVGELEGEWDRDDAVEDAVLVAHEAELAEMFAVVREDRHERVLEGAGRRQRRKQRVEPVVHRPEVGVVELAQLSGGA